MNPIAWKTNGVLQDTLNRNHLCECEMGSCLQEFLRLKFSITLMKPRSVQGQNEYNHENQW